MVWVIVSVKLGIIPVHKKSIDIVKNLESHEKYMIDSTTQPTLLDRPQNVTSAGNRTLPSVSTTF